MVVLLGPANLVARRVALGQIVIVYVVVFSNGGRTEAVMRPAHVAASTVVGMLACVLALLVPIPRLASREVKHITLPCIIYRAFDIYRACIFTCILLFHKSVSPKVVACTRV